MVMLANHTTKIFNNSKLDSNKIHLQLNGTKETRVTNYTRSSMSSMFLSMLWCIVVYCTLWPIAIPHFVKDGKKGTVNFKQFIVMLQRDSVNVDKVRLIELKHYDTFRLSVYIENTYVCTLVQWLK